MLLPWDEQCDFRPEHVTNSTASKRPPTKDMGTSSSFVTTLSAEDDDDEGELVDADARGTPLLPSSYDGGGTVGDGVVAMPCDEEDDVAFVVSAPPSVGDGVVVRSITAGAGVTTGAGVGAGVGKPGQEVGN